MSCMGRAEPSADRIPRLDLAHCLRDDAPHLLALAIAAPSSDTIHKRHDLQIRAIHCCGRSDRRRNAHEPVNAMRQAGALKTRLPPFLHHEPTSHQSRRRLAMQANDHGTVTPRCWPSPRRSATRTISVCLRAVGPLGRLGCASPLRLHTKVAPDERRPHARCLLVYRWLLRLWPSRVAVACES
jgi:hypothetical protein